MTAVIPRRLTPDSLAPVVLSAQEYEALPPSSRLELVDGVLHVMAPPLKNHQKVVLALNNLLELSCPEDLEIIREQELRMAELRRRNPDLMVVRFSEEMTTYSYAPADVLLAVEVVSPGSQTVDRLHKPAEYASAGIPHYWRIETMPAIELRAFRLGEAGHYETTGVFTGDDAVSTPDLPWVMFTIADLDPQRRR
jgi:Uma2 family endonuclease